MPSAHPGNALATVRQLSYSASQNDGVSAELEDSVRFAGSRLTQMAGILTRLPQDVVATAIVNFTRFWIGHDGGSIKEHAVKDVSAASLYLAAKLSPYPKSPRSILNVYAYLDVTASTLDFSTSKLSQPNPETYYLSESTYQARRVELMKVEALLLRTLGFQTQMTLPHNLSINYLQTLEVFLNPAGAEVAKQTFAHLNNALLSPQLLYLTHQPSSLATAAIYLSAREIGVKLPGENWWEVFDTDREELGFLVVALRSMEGFAREQKSKWADRRVPMTPSEVQQELKRQE